MNREIKFRGIPMNEEANGKDYIYGSLIVEDEGAHRIATSYIKDSEEPDLLEMIYARIVRPETVSQFSGRRDKNDKEIYEGDIIKFPDVGEEGYEYREGFDFENQAVVCFKNGRWELTRFASNNSAVLEDMNNSLHEEFMGVFEECEVIGDIFTTPELMGEKNVDWLT